MQDTSAPTVILLGRPGSGKGTQAALLAKSGSWKIISTGSFIKEVAARPDDVGAHVKSEYEKGLFSPDWLVAYFFVKEVVFHPRDEGIICEGFPRSLAQAELAEQILTWLGRPYVVINIVVSEEESFARQMSRSKLEHRPDSDEPDKIHTRFALYRTLTEPVVDFFKQRGVVAEINGEQTPEKIAEEIRAALGRA